MGSQDCFCRRRRDPYGEWRRYKITNVQPDCHFVLIDLPREPDDLTDALNELILTPLKVQRGEAAICIDQQSQLKRRVVVKDVEYPNLVAYDVDTGDTFRCTAHEVYQTNVRTRASWPRALRCHVPRSHIENETNLQEALQAAASNGDQIEAALIGWDELTPTLVRLPGCCTDIPAVQEQIQDSDQERDIMPLVNQFVLASAKQETHHYQQLYPMLPSVRLPPSGQFVEGCHVLHVEGDVAYVTWDDLLSADDFSCPLLQQLRGEPEESYEILSLEPGNLCMLYAEDNDVEVQRCSIEWVSDDGQEIRLRYIDCGSLIFARVEHLRLTALPKGAKKHPPIAVRVSFDIPVKGTAFLAPKDAVDRGPGKKIMMQVPIVNTAALVAEMGDLLRNSLAVDMYIVDLDEAEENVPNVIFHMDGHALSSIALNNISKRVNANSSIMSQLDVRMLGGGRTLDDEEEISSALRRLSIMDNASHSGNRQGTRNQQPSEDYASDGHLREHGIATNLYGAHQVASGSQLTATDQPLIIQTCIKDAAEHAQDEEHTLHVQDTPYVEQNGTVKHTALEQVWYADDKRQALSHAQKEYDYEHQASGEYAGYTDEAYVVAPEMPEYTAQQLSGEEAYPEQVCPTEGQEYQQPQREEDLYEYPEESYSAVQLAADATYAQHTAVAGNTHVEGSFSETSYQEEIPAEVDYAVETRVEREFAANAPAEVVYGEETSAEVVYGEETSAEVVYGEETSAEVVYGEETSAEVVYGEETPAEVVYGEETPAEVVYGEETPAEVVYGEETPAEVVYGEETPADVVYGEETPADVVYGEETPADVVYGEETPADVVYGEETSADVVYGEETSAEVVYGEETSAEVVYGEETSAEVVYGEETPAEVVYGEETPAEVVYGEETPAEVVYGEETPAEAVYGEETPAEVAYTEETPAYTRYEEQAYASEEVYSGQYCADTDAYSGLEEDIYVYDEQEQQTAAAAAAETSHVYADHSQQEYTSTEECGPEEAYAVTDDHQAPQTAQYAPQEELYYESVAYSVTGEEFSAQQYTEEQYAADFAQGDDASIEATAVAAAAAVSAERVVSQGPAVDVTAGGDDVSGSSRRHDPLGPGALWFGRVVSVRSFAQVNILPSVHQESLDQLEAQLGGQCKTLPALTVTPVTARNERQQQFYVIAFVTEGRGHRAKLLQRLPNGGAKVWLIDYERMASAWKIAQLPDHLLPNVLPPFVIKVSPSREQFAGLKFTDYRRLLEETAPDVMVAVECSSDNDQDVDIRIYTEDGVDIVDAYDIRVTS